MADSYVLSSSMIEIPAGKREQAQGIIDRLEEEAENADELVGYIAELQDEGVWIYGEEWFDTASAARLVETLVDELDLPGVFVCSWACTCSKPRIDEFTGGAFAVEKGHDTIWVCADRVAEQLAADRRNAEVST